MRSTAAPSDTPGRSPNDTDTDGSWPEWLTLCGPTVSFVETTDWSGTSAPRGVLNESFSSESAYSLVFRIELDEHAVLRRRAVDRRRPLRAEARGQRVLDLRGVEADGRRLVAVDDEVDLRALDLEVVRDVLDFRHLRLHRRAQALRPGVELVGVGALHRDVVAAVADAAADLERRRDVDERAVVREPQELRPELLRDLLRRHRALGARQELHLDLRRFEPRRRRCRRRSDHEAVDVRVLLDDLGRAQRARAHVVERRALRRAQVDEQRVVVLIGDEPLRDDAVHVDRAGEHRDEHDDHHEAVAQHDAEAPLVAVEQPRRTRGRAAREAVLRVHDAQEAAAEHRRQRDRDDAGNQNRRRDRDRELAEQPAEDAAHEQNRDEDRGERRRHRQNREADFLRALQRRLERIFARLHVAHDVLEHHDRVVDDEADREDQRHHREVVQAEVQHLHHGERAEDREGQRQRRE